LRRTKARLLLNVRDDEPPSSQPSPGFAAAKQPRPSSFSATRLVD
jgi:hypothetical protein